MAIFYFYLGNGFYEFERPEIKADIGIKMDIEMKRYKAVVKGMKNMEYLLKQNDTRPYMEAQLLDANGEPVNLDFCGVHFHMKSLCSGKMINRPAEIVDAENGKVKVTWREGDLEVPGSYKCEFQVNFTDFTTLTVPNDGYFLIRIIEELA